MARPFLALAIICAFKNLLLKFFEADPGAGMEKIWIREPGWEKFGSGIRDGKISDRGSGLENFRSQDPGYTSRIRNNTRLCPGAESGGKPAAPGSGGAAGERGCNAARRLSINKAPSLLCRPGL